MAEEKFLYVLYAFLKKVKVRSSNIIQYYLIKNIDASPALLSDVSLEKKSASGILILYRPTFGPEIKSAVQLSSIILY